jgi:hypothetical protein
MTTTARPRQDLHNISIDFAAATQGLCGFTHLSTGRVCRLPYHHPGPCELQYRRTPAAAGSAKAGPAG